MLKFNKVFKGKIITVAVTMLFLLNSTAQGIALPKKTQLRPYLITNGSNEKEDLSKQDYETTKNKIEEIFLALQGEGLSEDKKIYLRIKLEKNIHHLHRTIPDKEIGSIKKLGERINDETASIKDLYDKLSEVLPLGLIKHIKHKEESWKTYTGEYMDAGEYKERFIKGITSLSSGNENYFNSRMAPYEDRNNKLDETDLYEVELIYQDLHRFISGRFALALTFILHDYGKLLAIDGYPEYGARLAVSLLERLTPEYAGQIIRDIEEQDAFSAIASGKYIVNDMENNMKRRILILEFIKDSSIGQGRITKNRLKEFLACVDKSRYKVLRARWAKARLLRFLYFDQPIVLQNIDQAFQKGVLDIDDGNIWSDMDTLGMRKIFMDFLGQVKFKDDLDINRSLASSPSTVIKWLFMLCMIKYATGSGEGVPVIRYSSELTSKVISDWDYTYTSIKDIMELYYDIEAIGVKPDMTLELHPGLRVTLGAQGQGLLVHTDKLDIDSLSGKKELVAPESRFCN